MLYRVVHRMAFISPCGLYRPLLTRSWHEGTGTLHICGLNPSTADGDVDDPTMVREMDFAQRLGFRGLWKTNLFSFRATDPRDMITAVDPIGPHADLWIKESINMCEMSIAAWGVLGTFKKRDKRVINMFEKLYAFKINQDGTPQHPLYLPATTKPFLWIDNEL